MNKIYIFNGRKKPFKFEVVVQHKDKKNGELNLKVSKIVLPKNHVFKLKTSNKDIQVELEKKKLVFYFYRKS